MQKLLEALADTTWITVRRGLELLLLRDDPGLWEVLAEGCWVWPDGEIEVSGRSRIHRLQGDPRLRRAIALYALCRSGRMRRSTSLDLRGCEVEAIREVLPWLPAVEQITWDLEGAPADLSVLAGLERLRALRLAGCGALQDLEGLAGLGRLSALRLEGCGALVSAEAVAGLAGLRSLRLSGCDALASLALPGGGGLERVSAEDCGALERVAGPELPGLTELTLWGCGQLHAVTVQSAPQLSRLYLNGCDPGLELAGLLPILGNIRMFGVGWPVLARALGLLRGMPELKILSVSEGGEMPDTGWLAGLASLRGLRLEGCGGADFGGISGLVCLNELSLSDCPRLEHLDFLHGLAGLREVMIRSCPALTDIGGLSENQRLFYRVLLHSCAALADMRPLAGNEIVSLEVINCPSVVDIGPLVESGAFLLTVANPGVACRRPGLSWRDAEHPPLPRQP